MRVVDVSHPKARETKTVLILVDIIFGDVGISVGFVDVEDFVAPKPPKSGASTRCEV
jgi:hypothetical protein